MPGAYTAKPDAAVAPPDVPDGWDIDWDFPGAYPPGYAPDFSLNLSATESIAYSGAVTATTTLRDHDTYATIEPSGCSISWTATIDGVAVGIRFSGDEDYESSLSLSYSEGVTYWGATPEIEFELSEDNVGDTAVLTATSTVSGYALAETADIVITQVIPFECVIEYGYTPGENWFIWFSATVKCYNPSSSTIYPGIAGGDIGDGVTWAYYGGDIGDAVTFTSDASGVHGLLDYGALEDEQYISIKLSNEVQYTGTLTSTATLTIGETVYTKTFSGDVPSFEWLRIDSDGIVTVITP